MPDELPEVTLFVAAYNEERVVDEKMANTRSLDYPADRLKVVWVTDGSDDSTNRRLEAYPEVEIFFQPERQGKTAALNRGIEFVETSLVVFTDANTMLNREAIREIVRCFSDPTVGCVAGEKRIAVRRLDGAAAGGEGLYWKYESALKRLDWRLYSAMGAAGELFAVRRGLFERMENDTLLDDFVLSLRIVQKGYRIAYCDTAYAIEGASSDMKEEQKRKVRICAGGLQSIGRLRPLLNVFRYGVVSFMFLSHRVLRWSLTPLLLFLLLPVNAALAFSGSPEKTGIGFGRVGKSKAGLIADPPDDVRKIGLDVFFDHCGQLSHDDGLGHVVVTACVDRFLLVAVESVGSKCDDRDFRIDIPDCAGCFQSVHLRHFDVHQDQVGLLFFVNVDGFDAVVCP